MKRQKLCPALTLAIMLVAVNFFSSCSTGGNPSEEGYTNISGTLAGGAGEILRSGPSADSPAAAPLASYQLYCTTVQAPIIEGSGVAGPSGYVAVRLNIKSGAIACSVLDPQGNRIAKLIFSDASGTSQSQVISGGGEINLNVISVNPATGEAHAAIPSNVSLASVNLPKTTITSKPSNPTSSQSAEFQFNSDQANCTFECKLDAGGWEACASPKNYTGLAVTSHTFQVRAKNASGYVEPAPASYTWTIRLDSWVATTTTNAPSAREAHTAVWTGTEMIVWGGSFYDGSVHYLNTGGRYNPSTDSWVATTTTNAPSGRNMHTTVWTGNKMIVWGGNDGSSHLNTGGRYNPSTNSWVATTATDAPLARQSHTAVWAGTVMIIWGGIDTSVNYLNTGGRYNPSTNSWEGTSTTNAPEAREMHTAVWAAEMNEMIVWGGWNVPNTGGRYNPTTNSWEATSTSNAPPDRCWHSAVWTGTEMIVWGGWNGSFLNSGGRYNPLSNSWTATSLIDAPSSRDYPSAVWADTMMIVWGGNNGPLFLNTGGRYDPATDSWAATTITNAPTARFGHSAVWTGTEMIIWGGAAGGPIYFNTGGRYVP